MAIRTWGRSLLVALGVSALAGAGQLGIAYGLGILRFTRSFVDAPGHWPAQLVWVSWFAVGATMAGAVVAERYARRADLPVTTVVQVTIAVAATVGATVVAPLCMLPARNAQVPSGDPVLTVAVSALFGALAGTVAAVAVLRYAPVGWNVATSTAALWLLALLSVVPSLGAVGPLPAVRLGALDPAWLLPDTAGRLAMLILPGLALLVGAAVAGVARWRGLPALLGGASGVGAPLLVAVAYLIAGPGRGDDGYQSGPYLAALLAVPTGALGAAAATVLRRPPLDAATLLRWPPPAIATLLRRSPPAIATLLRRPFQARTRTRSDAIEPTDILRPLPAGTGLPPVPAPARPTDDPVPAPVGVVVTAPPVPDAAGHDVEPAAWFETTIPQPAVPTPEPTVPAQVERPGHERPGHERLGPEQPGPERPGPERLRPERLGPERLEEGAEVPAGPGATGRPGSGPTGDAAGESSGAAGPQPIGRLPWHVPQATSADRNRLGTTDWPSPPGTTEAVSTGGLDWSRPDPTRYAGDTSTGTGPGAHGDSAVAGPGPAGTTGEQGDASVAGGLRKLRGLLRRDRSPGGAGTAGRSEGTGGREREEPALLPHDEEYVDWVAQLGQPMPDTTASSDPGDRRTLRAPGRHQRD
ncbi:hypothetical protein ACIBJE_15210 [Micromonospora sp. NPDC050187]|uniref:hypothetical protein n=1 Tax=Micromonospora sp. NPDC050187 TaxID=3364277 RepID=UPI0037A6BE4D